jgi:hypothetical protein
LPSLGMRHTEYLRFCYVTFQTCQLN